MSELPDLSAQKPYALDQLAQLQGKIIQLSKSMVLQRASVSTKVSRVLLSSA